MNDLLKFQDWSGPSYGDTGPYSNLNKRVMVPMSKFNNFGLNDLNLSEITYKISFYINFITSLLFQN